MPAAIHVWTEADRQTVADLLLAGKSARLIGAALGLTRNAIIGKLHRDDELHRLVGKQYSAVKMQREKPPKPKRPAIPSLKVKPDKNGQNGLNFGFPVGKSAPPQPMPPEPSGIRHLPLLGLRSRECRFAIAEDHSVIGYHLFCGRPTGGDVYCREHRTIASPGRRGDG
jgi:hypothetical protein